MTSRTGFALTENQTGDDNVAIGFNALADTTVASEMVAIGNSALENNSNGGAGVAVGFESLQANTSGNSNTGVGYQSLLANSDGAVNTAVGSQALSSNVSGDSNTAVGGLALGANTGDSNIGVGVGAGLLLTTGSNNIDIGNLGAAGESNTIRIGTSGTQTATYIAGIDGAAIGSGTQVQVNSSGRLGTTVSSARFKTDIQDMGKESDGLMRLRPVRYYYKEEIDPSHIEQYGLVAEEVARIYPDLVTYDESGKPEAVRYHFVNAMVVNELQKQAVHIHELEGALQAQASQIEELTGQLAAATSDEVRALGARIASLESALRSARALPASYSTTEF